MKKVLLMSGFFYFSLFSMDQQLTENDHFVSNISDVSGSDSSEDESILALLYVLQNAVSETQNAVSETRKKVGKGIRATQEGQETAENLSLTDALHCVYTAVVVQDGELETITNQLEDRKKKNDKTFLLVATILKRHETKIKKQEKQIKKQKKQIKKLDEKITKLGEAVLNRTQDSEQKKQTLVLREPENSDNYDFESSGELLLQLTEATVVKYSPRKLRNKHRLSLDGKKLEKRNSPRRSLFRRISKRNHK